MVKSGRCTLYNLGSFKIEEMDKEFQKRKLHLENNVILAVSHFCMPHLSDSVGTFAQIFNLLQTQLGLFLADGFFFLFEDDSWESYEKQGSSANTYMSLVIMLKFHF